MEAAKHVVVHEHQRSHDLVVAGQREGLELGHVCLLFKSPLARQSNGHHIGVHEEPFQLKCQPLWRNTVAARGREASIQTTACLPREAVRSARSRVVEPRHRLDARQQLRLAPHVTRPRAHGSKQRGFVGHDFWAHNPAARQTRKLLRRSRGCRMSGGFGDVQQEVHDVKRLVHSGVASTYVSVHECETLRHEQEEPNADSTTSTSLTVTASSPSMS